MINILFTLGPLAFIVILASLILAITIHEFAHAYAANKLGDPTPKLQGRLSLNPKVHLDPLGTILLVLFGFGWGKPVMFDPYNLRNPRRDAAIISLAGPLSNIIMAVVLAIILRITATPFSPIISTIGIIELLIYFNLLLALFNLIPIHPLDGGKIFIGLLPEAEAKEADVFLRKYGLIILLLLIFPVLGGRSAVTAVLIPLVNFFTNILIGTSFI